MRTVEFLKHSRSGPWLVGALCALMLIPWAPARADAIPFPQEYEALVNLVAIIVVVISSAALPGGSNVVGDQLQTAVQGASLANSQGDSRGELVKLSKAIGAAEALFGMTASCGDCSDLRSELQQVIGKTAQLRSAALGAVGACVPDGVIRGNEQCDPLIQPNGGCLTIELTFCNDDCQCQPITTP